MKFKISMMILLLVILKAMHAAEPVNPCPNELEHIVVDMCTDDSAIEDSVDGSKTVDSVLLRITKQKNNCICYVSLQNAATNYKIYMSKYDLLSNSAPEQSNCGLAVDVDYVDTSDITRSLQSINCTHGTGVRSIALGGNELIFKSRIISGDFSRGYCMQIYRNQAILICKMNDQIGYSGSDDDWITAYRTKNTSVEECKQYCMQTKACVAVHYEHINNYCFVYNTTTVLHYRDNTTYSQKNCMDTQKLKIKCYPLESTTQTDQATSRENTFTANLETITNPISDKQVTVSTTQSSIEKEKENIKDTSPSFLVALVIAIIGCTVAVIFAGTTVWYKRQLLTQKSKSPLAPSVNYVDLSVASEVSDYSAINTQVVNEQYETVNART